MHTDRQDGSRFEPMGPNAVGQLVYDANGRVSMQIMRADRPRFASGSRMGGTPEENKAAVQGTISYFGRYAVNETERTVIHHIEGSLFPNWNGTGQKRFFTFTGDELKLSAPPIQSPDGPIVSHLVWKRAR